MIKDSPEKHKKKQEERVNVLKRHFIYILKSQGFKSFQSKIEKQELPIPKESIDSELIENIIIKIYSLLDKIEYETSEDYIDLGILNIFTEKKEKLFNTKITGLNKKGEVFFIPTIKIEQKIEELHPVSFIAFNKLDDFNTLIQLYIILVFFEKQGFNPLQKLCKEEYDLLSKRAFPKILAINKNIFSQNNKRKIRRLISKFSGLCFISVSIGYNSIIRVSFQTKYRGYVYNIKFIPNGDKDFVIELDKQMSDIKTITQLFNYIKRSMK